MFSEDGKLCIFMETCVQSGWEAVYIHGDLCSVRMGSCVTIFMETCVQ